jgi:hypothetical protein
MAPDLQYFLTGKPEWGIGHTLFGQFTFCLPMTLATLWLCSRLIARPLALHLPDGGAFHLRDYRVLAETPRHLAYWAKAIPSALIGSFSHIVWDGFTHPGGWAAQKLGYAQKELFPLGSHSLLVCKALQSGSTVFGAVVTLWLLHRIGRERLLLKWAEQPLPEPEISPTRDRAFWLPALLIAVLGTSLFAVQILTLATPGHLNCWISLFLRAALSGFVGLCVGGLFWERQKKQGN